MGAVNQARVFCKGSVPIASSYCDKPKRLEKEGVYFSSQAIVHYPGKPRQEAKQRSQKSSAYWLASPGCLRLLSSTTHVHSPRDGSAHRGLGLLTSTSN